LAYAYASDLVAGLRRIIACMVAMEQMRTLQTYGLNEFHVSTLNRSDLTYAIAHILGVLPTKTNASCNVAGLPLSEIFCLIFRHLNVWPLQRVNV